MAICVYAENAADFGGNGLGTLRPSAATVSETDKGAYTLTLTAPMEADGKWRLLTEGRLLKAPSPAAPVGALHGESLPVYATTAKTWVFSRASTGSKKLLALRVGDEVTVTAAGDAWHAAVATDGTAGFVQASKVAYVRTERSGEGAAARGQLFRIFDVLEDSEARCVTVQAQHVFYDLADNVTTALKLTDQPPSAALTALDAAAVSEHDFAFHTDLEPEDGTVSGDFGQMNLVEALLDPERGMAVTLGADVARDNFDVSLLKRQERDRGFAVRYGKNLQGVTVRTNGSTRVTRLVPVASDSSGAPLFLPEVFVDSPNAAEGCHVRTGLLPVNNVRVGGDGVPTKAVAYQKMRDAVQEQWAAGSDTSTVEVEVRFLNLGDTEEYAAWRDLYRAHLYDTVTLRHPDMLQDTKLRVVAYEWDCLTGRYVSVTMGTTSQTAGVGAVAGWQLGVGSVSGSKIVPGSVDASHLRELSVTTARIANAAITSAKIAVAAIENAHIADATIGVAKIKDFAAEVATLALAEIARAEIDAAQITALDSEVAKLVAASIVDARITSAQVEDFSAAAAGIAQAEIAQARIGTAQVDELAAYVADVVHGNIESATIDWAEIAQLSADVAVMVSAQMANASIGYAQITGLTGDVALFEATSTGKLYCAELLVQDANIESLTAGKIAGGLAELGALRLIGADGKLYEISVDDVGQVVAVERPVSGDELGDYTVTERNLADGTLTARTLNVGNIFADEAFLQSLHANALTAGSVTTDKLAAQAVKASHIDVGEVFANAATFGRITARHLAADIGQGIDISSNEYIRLVVSTLRDTADALDGYKAYTSSYLRFTAEDGLELGEAGSAQLLRMRNNRLSFLETGREVAYISGQRMYITRLQVTEALVIGDGVRTCTATWGMTETHLTLRLKGREQG